MTSLPEAHSLQGKLYSAHTQALIPADTSQCPLSVTDAMRPFILHAYGGVYLDMDTECLRTMDHTLQSPMFTEPWDLILSAEKADLINNAQVCMGMHALQGSAGLQWVGLRGLPAL